jgi:hypothetical protein
MNLVSRPQIVVLVGSTRFKRAFEEANREESAAGKIVLTVCWFTHSDGPATDGQEAVFKSLHYLKIDMADEVFVVNPGGYIGASTRKEIAYALIIGKPIRYLEPVHLEPV